jgi:hypothetical protein
MMGWVLKISCQNHTPLSLSLAVYVTLTILRLANPKLVASLVVSISIISLSRARYFLSTESDGPNRLHIHCERWQLKC